MPTNLPGSKDTLVNPVLGNPLSLSNGKNQVQYIADLNDAVEGLEDIAFRRSSASFVNASDFASLPSQLINGAETTTGWSSTAFPVTTNTANFTEGAASVRTTMYVHTAQDPEGDDKFVFNLPAALPRGPYTHLAFDVQWEMVPAWGDYPLFNIMDARVSDGTNFTGNLKTAALPFGIPVSTWTTVYLDISTLATVRSIGLQKRVSTTGTQQFWRTYVYIDNIRFKEMTRLDAALQSSPTVGVMVPPDYTTGGPAQFPITPSPTKTVLSLRPDRTYLSRSGGWRDIREYEIDDTGTTDVSQELNAVLDTLPDGSRLRLAADGRYRADFSLYAQNLRNVWIDGNGATIFSGIPRGTNDPLLSGDHQIIFSGYRNVELRNLRVLGYNSSTHAGSNLATVAGTPTVSGSTVILDAQNEEVRIPVEVGYGLTHAYARNVDGDNVFKFRLSDVNHVANDCLIAVYDNATNTLVSSKTIPALTATPTDYILTFKPLRWGRAFRVTVKKLTATANPITVTSINAWGKNLYSKAREFSSGVYVSGGGGLLVEDCVFEGNSGNGFCVESPGAYDVWFRRCISSCNALMGGAFTWGTRLRYEDSEIYAPGWSAFDIEPYDVDWFARDIFIKNIKCYDSYFFNIALGGTLNRVSDVHFEDIWCNYAGAGMVFGSGMNHCTFKNMQIDGVSGGGAVDWSLGDAHDCEFRDITVQRGLSISGKGNRFDGVTVNDVERQGPMKMSSGNTLHNVNYTGEATTMAGFLVRVGVGNTGGAQYSDYDVGTFRTQFPNTYKGIAQHSFWSPRGVDLLDEPVWEIRSLSGGTTKGNNFRGLNVAVAAGIDTSTVAFPARSYPSLTHTDNWTSSNQAGGTLVPATTYYYRLGARDKYSGPVFGAEKSVTIATGMNATVTTVADFAAVSFVGPRGTGLHIPGLTILRGTTAGGPYTHRYDFLPSADFYTFTTYAHDFYDIGSLLDTRILTGEQGYPSSVAVATGSWTGANETGNEPDTNYAVMLFGFKATTGGSSWKPQYQIAATRQNGFDVEFDIAPPAGGGSYSWMILR